VTVAGTVLAALLLRPDGHLVRGKGLVPSALLTTLLAIAWLLGCLALYARHRRQIRYDAPLGPLERRLVTGVRGALLAAAFAVPVLVVGLHRLRWHARAAHPHKRKRLPVVQQIGGGVVAHRGSSYAPALYAAVAVVLVLLAVALVIRHVRRRGERARVPEQVPPPDGNEAQLLAEALESGRRALRGGGDARTGVIACYAAMEASLAASGIAKRASDTPQNLLERAAAGGLRTEGSVSVLTQLFREARYSTHPMAEPARARAAAALTDIAEQVAARRALAGATR
jgi:hypothetical protein